MQTHFKSTLSKEAISPVVTRLAAAYTKAREYAVYSVLTDLSLVYSPSQIAIGCLKLASSELGFEAELEGYLRATIGRQAEGLDCDGEEEDVYGKFMERVEGMQGMIKGARGSVATKAECQEIDGKLKGCKNPAFVEGSAVSKKREREEEEEGERKRRKKSITAGDDGGSVFL